MGNLCLTGQDSLKPFVLTGLCRVCLVDTVCGNCHTTCWLLEQNGDHRADRFHVMVSDTGAGRRPGEDASGEQQGGVQGQEEPQGGP